MKRRILQNGQVTAVVTILFLIIIVFVVVRTTSSVSRAVGSVKISKSSLESLSVSDSAQEDIIYRVRSGLNYSDVEVLTIGLSIATSTITDDFEAGEKIIETVGDTESNIRKRNTLLVKGDSVSFNYGVQVGQGGFLLKNLSSVTGNVHSGGSVVGTNDNIIRGAVISSGPDGLVDGIHATSSAYSNDIVDSTIEGDAYYMTISGSTVWGTLHPDSPDQPYRDLPISDETIDSWKTIAEEGGVSEECTIQEDIYIGPLKFNCTTLLIKQDAVVTLGGMIWVTGNIEVENNAIVNIDPTLGRKSLAMIADNEADRITSSIIYLSNNAEFNGTGETSSQIILVSANNDQENGGSAIGIELENNNAGDLSLYCNHCRILIKNNAVLTSVTAYLVEMQNNAELIYEEGIASSVFDTGPGGSWDIAETAEVL